MNYTPTQKAKRLIHQFANHSKGDTIETNLNSAINCSLILVNEIIDTLKKNKKSTQFNCCSNVTYWKHVLVELESIDSYDKDTYLKN